MADTETRPAPPATASVLPASGRPVAPVDDAVEMSLRRPEHLQHTLIDLHQQIFMRWCQRRHETVEAAYGLARATLAADQPATTVASLTTWWLGAVRRVSEDVDDQAEYLANVIRFCSGTSTWSREDGLAEVSAQAESGGDSGRT